MTEIASVCERGLREEYALTDGRHLDGSGHRSHAQSSHLGGTMIGTETSPDSMARTTARASPDARYACPPVTFPSGVGVGPAALLVVLLAAACGLTMTRAPVVDELTGLTTGEFEHPALVAGLSLALVAVWAYVALRRLVVTPIQYLRCDLESAVAGQSPEIRGSVSREVDLIADSVRGDTVEGRRTVTTTTILGLVAAVIVSWLVVTPFTVSEGAVTEPALTAAGQEATDASAAVVRHELEGGLSGLNAVAADAPRLLDPASTAARVLSARPIFKGVSVLDPGAGTLAAAGDGRATFSAVPAPGLALLNDAGAEPHLVASAPLSGGLMLVGEFDIRALNDRLRTPGSVIAVVDAEMRTILSSSGYQAFEPLRGDAQREAAERALEGTPAVATAAAGTAPGVTASVVGFGDASASLRLVSVGQHDRSAALFASSPARRTSAVLAGIAGVLALVLLTWTYISAVRPLRSLTDHARVIADVPAGGRIPTPIPPERLNETGAIAVALNHILARVVIWKTARIDDERPAGACGAVAVDQVSRRDQASCPTRIVELRVSRSSVATVETAQLSDEETLLLDRDALTTAGR